MALIKCPECGKEISDKAASCPNCGCPIAYTSTPRPVNPVDVIDVTSEKCTDVGEFRTHTIGGVGMIVAGVLVIIIGIPLIPFVVGIFVIALGIIILTAGTIHSKGAAECVCPYCGTYGSITKGESSYTCSACKKISVYMNEKNQLKTVRE